jgi:solute carrier family 25 aspartate/glutamate transporter 12/13
LEEIATPESTAANNDVLSGVLHFCKEFLEHFAMGSIAGGIGAAAVYPIDLGKTRLQNQVLVKGQAPQYQGVLDAMRKVFVSEGPVGLYRGLFPQLAGVAPEKAIKLTVNDTLRKWFKSWNVGTDEDSISIPLEVLAGAGGGMAQVAFTNPMEIVKIRLQMASMNEASARPSAVNVVKELGLRGLYKGATACFMRDIPFSAIYFPTYATLRKALQGEKEHASALDLFVAGGVAGAPAASLVTPADVIKTRLQTKLPNGKYMYNSIKEASVEIYKNEGFNAFFKGAPARVLRSSPQFAVTLLAYETLQRVLGLDQDENAKYAPPTNAPIGNFG